MIVQWLLASYSVTAVTYATWNPADKSASSTLSGWNLTTTSSGASWNSARSTIGKSSGKWYWEITFTGADTITGIANSSASLTTFVWWDANWRWLYNANWQKYISAWWTAYTTAFSAGTVIWVALDMDTWEITFLKNNTSLWVAFTWLSWTYYAMGSTVNSSTQTANFGSTALTYSPPAWFNAWLYN